MAFVTRFAPSPTGPLHLGHAYSAILAHDMARAEGGQFHLRMEDLDGDRAKPTYEAQILDDLAWLGLTWDGPVHRQSDHIASYTARLEALADRQVLYPCSCTRSDIRAVLAAPQEGVAFNVYPGTCRGRAMASRQAGDALRLDMAAAFAVLGQESVSFKEMGPAGAAMQVIKAEQALRQLGDVILARKGDGIVAYFLAAALDDADLGVTHVIRGEDLLEFTPIQVILQHLFGLPTPIYHHHRLIRDDQGKRLAKRDDARALGKYRAEGATPGDIRAMVGL
jgi:glutamyl-Q tRNA(Asp) synthetase